MLLMANTFIEMDYLSDAWILTLIKELQKESDIKPPLPSSHVKSQLQCIGSELCHPGNQKYKLGWLNQIFLTRKRKRRKDSEQELLKEECQVLKKVRIDEPKFATKTQAMQHKVQNVRTANKMEEIPELPGAIKICISKLREILHGEEELESLDSTLQAHMKEMFELCNPIQLESIFSSLRVQEISPKSLLQLCCILDALTPDLSLSHSLVVASSLFKKKVLSLTLPAPRPLLAALSVFCRKYAHSACSILIGSLTTVDTDSVQTDFLCRMISESLHPDQLHLCFDPLIKMPLSEGSLCVLHTLLERQAAMSHTEFQYLFVSLCHSAEDLSKSVTFAKLMMTIMRRNHNMVTSSHLGPLTNAINCNQTFLKKSLQGALKKLQDNSN
ncbi:hypothetical protein GDO86_003310 [Hymenochirus boettgeri]|nr:hypothetical protein GDO86_003310 [Hymenochirus boettgeri]